jgi:hypothetical protein
MRLSANNLLCLILILSLLKATYSSPQGQNTWELIKNRELFVLSETDFFTKGHLVVSPTFRDDFKRDQVVQENVQEKDGTGEKWMLVSVEKANNTDFS